MRRVDDPGLLGDERTRFVHSFDLDRIPLVHANVL